MLKTLGSIPSTRPKTVTNNHGFTTYTHILEVADTYVCPKLFFVHPTFKSSILPSTGGGAYLYSTLPALGREAETGGSL